MNMKTKEAFYRLALNAIKGIGPIRFKKIVDTLQDTSLLFSATKKVLLHEFGLPRAVVDELKAFTDFSAIEQELTLIDTHGIQVYFHDDPEYPEKLSMCADAPPIIFYKGQKEALSQTCVSIIGTRKHTDYGKKLCEDVVLALSKYPVTIVSGLAYGIDSIAHQQAVKGGQSTIGVVAHGLKEMYPAGHAGLARQMQQQGGLLSEYFYETPAAKENFPSRNRIVAGMSDATIIIETDRRGGSMITAELAYSYNRDVLCFPGKVTDSKSAGCNYLIKTLKAQMVTSGEDIIHALGLVPKKKNDIQRHLFLHLSEEEQRLVDSLRRAEMLHMDELLVQSTLSTSQLSNAMLSLELQGVIQVKPGKMVCLI